MSESSDGGDSGAGRLEDLKAISLGADFVVAKFAAGEQGLVPKKRERSWDLDARQERLRVKLDEILEVEYQRLFGKTPPDKGKDKTVPSEDHKAKPPGIRMFRYVKAGMPITEQKLGVGFVQPKVQKKKSREKGARRKWKGADGVWRFEGLAVVDTDSVLRTAETIRQGGKQRLMEKEQSLSPEPESQARANRSAVGQSRQAVERGGNCGCCLR